MILTETPRRKIVTKLVSWGHWFALLNIIVGVVIASIYVFTSPFPGNLLGTAYLFTNWFSHIAFLTFIGFVILLLPLCYLLANARLVKAVGSVVAALGLALLAFDALLYNKYGLHLSISSAELIRNETQTVMAAFGWQQWGFLLLLFVVWLSFQLIIANALWKRIERVQKYRLGIPISSFFVFCFMFSHASHIWADANLYEPIVYQDDMFPLSYPATAKTLMSKYGMLDIENYQKRKALRFQPRVGGIKYPASAVYCSINTGQSLVMLIITDQADLHKDLNLHKFALRSYANHYNLNSDLQSAQLSSLFGLPELYLPALAGHTPLLLDLPSKLGLPVALYTDLNERYRGIAHFRQNWDDFSQQLAQVTPKLAIGFVTGSELQSLLDAKLIKHNQVLIGQLGHADRASYLYTNLPLRAALSSNEDLAATALNALGCAAEAQNYSTGQSLLNPSRNWLVSTQGNKVVVLHNGLRTEVSSNGNYKIFERETGQESATALNTGLLSQTMKHLSRFNK